MDSGRLEAVPPGAVHLDTVRALHQTVVSLRTALESSKNELKELKEKYKKHSHCIEYVDVIEKLSLENHILRRKIIDSGYEDKDPIAQNIKLEVTYSPRSQNIEEEYSSQVLIESGTERDTSQDKLEDLSSDKQSNYCSTEKLNEIVEISKSPEVQESAEVTPHDEPDITEIEEHSQVSHPEEEHSQITTLPKEDFLPSFKTKLELLSKFDVRIKVRTLKEGTIPSSTTSESSTEDKKEFERKTDSTARFQFEERREQFENAEDPSGNKISVKSVSTDNIKMAVPNEGDVKKKTDKFDVQVKITSEENLVVNQNVERSRRKDTLNLDVDDLSLRSMSEGDNSVFSEGGTTPLDPSARGMYDKDQDNASGNESEEVDDIELIFTTDESKDMSNLQEDLVSIRETDTWAPQSASTTHSTPVLIKFHTLDPDFQPSEDNAQTKKPIENVIPESSLRTKRVSLPSDKDIRHVAFNSKGNLELPGRGILKSCDNKSDNMLYKRSPNASTRRLDSVDSLTCEYNRGLSFDNTKSSSFELGSSMDILHREGSVDNFPRASHLGHRFSVFAETDISKCGISEDDLAANLNIRRNTCPNPFQYKPSQYRMSIRPSRREAGPRRESGAQTDLSALPPRWSSDGFLAHQMCSSRAGGARAPTVPVRAPPRPPVARPPPPRTDEARRVLLSDIGFTSMVPELSRSADPLWAAGRRPPTTESTTNSTSKFLSRGSSYRSPCVSIDRSNDWTPQTLHLPSNRACSRGWRSSLPDVRRDDTEELLEEAEVFVRRSIDNLHVDTYLDLEKSSSSGQIGQPYIPAEPKHLRLGHTVKVITPQGRIAVGRVRYVGLAGGSAAGASVVVGAEFVHSQHPGLARNDGMHRGRRYFLTPPQHTALFLPFSKVVMAWAN